MKNIEVKGMSCEHCVMSVTKALSAVPNVAGVKVDLAGKKASFEEKGAVDLEAVRQAIAKAGFEPGAVS